VRTTQTAQISLSALRPQAYTCVGTRWFCTLHYFPLQFHQHRIMYSYLFKMYCQLNSEQGTKAMSTGKKCDSQWPVVSALRCVCKTGKIHKYLSHWGRYLDWEIKLRPSKYHSCDYIVVGITRGRFNSIRIK
jgi:hypothetical protein